MLDEQPTKDGCPNIEQGNEEVVSYVTACSACSGNRREPGYIDRLPSTEAQQPWNILASLPHPQLKQRGGNMNG